MPSFDLRARALALGCAAFLLFASAAHAASVSLQPYVPGIGLRVRDGLDGSKALARGWAPDAALVHVESDDEVFKDGTARAWTYLWWSPRERSTHGWTVRKSGDVNDFDLAFPFDPPPLEDGWMDGMKIVEKGAKDPSFARALEAGPLVKMVVTNGLWTDQGAAHTAWILGFAEHGLGDREWIGDALRGTAIVERAARAVESGAVAGGRGALPPWLGAHATAALTRSASLREDPARVLKERERWLAPREAAALTRLAGRDAALDTLGMAAATQAAGEVDASLAALQSWNQAAADADSLLARSALRIENARLELSAERPTEVAVYLALESRGRPERVSLFVDNLESARATYGEPEWRALDAGAWAEVARRTVRSGLRELRVEIEGADHRIQNATWRGTVAAGRLTLLRLRIAGGERASTPPALEFVTATAP